MPKTRPPYSPEFRRQMVDLVRAGRDPAELAREFEPTAQSISHWVAQADRQEGRREEKGGGLTAAERDELAAWVIKVLRSRDGSGMEPVDDRGPFTPDRARR